ncbi:PREDICTED: probable inactive receptor kinase At4g23740 [Nelumbo nucifera]|uniref:Probable inactive receptor kinase At4g23740 n=1 Tax=Nelumbo nucifera TaxID=4432 RepID=A0A1U7ZIZ8_NELNU|nr:PREDICTED: probable inactive receptor kinase At4g23740 [Nelumbo nucifera]XP_010251543.1 PREDICTED: probable inactive receptor kinase At4g23740 [Nelumbo nucifera]
MDARLIFYFILLFGLLFWPGAADPVEDKQALLDFVNSIPHSRYLNWNQTCPVCDCWTGVTCNSDKTRIIAVRLPGVGFQGRIPPNTLSRLSALQILSLRSNGLTGPFPSDFANLRNLSFLYLQFNKFYGPLPSDFSVWRNLTIINLSFNAFNGSIPSSLSNLTQLTALNLANNSLSGEIPDLQLPNLQQLNLANNSLVGTVPKSLQKFPNLAFSGNSVSFPNSPPPIIAVSPPSPQPFHGSRNVKKLGESTLLGIIIGGCVLGFLSIATLLILFCSKREGDDGFVGKSQKGERSPEKAVQGNQDRNNRLVFFEGCNYAFDLEDLLRASAEVLGKGTFGTSYKAVLEDAITVVVKRLKELSVGKKEFEQQMELVGSIRHENVAELRAYYFSKDEKLMVYDYYTQGSVSALLHGRRGEERVPLDWDTRLRIAIGAARGIAYIHAESGGKLVHGNIKSSNIFLNSQNYGCVSDLGLAALMSPVAPPISRAAGYRAPEVLDTRKATQASDVYSYGVLLLELLTGKSPVHATGGDEVVHLVRWVHSVVREEWTAEVFDVELMRYPNIEEEMVGMLQIAMACVVRMPEQRPKMPDVVKMLEDIRRLDTGDRQSTETKSESSTPTPQQLPRAGGGMESSSVQQ